jgi:RNA polymerase sigma factor (sigma-70 family)
MSVVTTEPAVETSAEAEERFTAIYEQNFVKLASIAVRKFRVPETEAETLAHEVFLSYLRRHESINDLNGWLVGAICHASRHYWRLNGRMVAIEDELEFDRVDPTSTNILDSLPDQIAAREALECLSPRCQEILRLRYFEGWTMHEIADHFGVKPKYAQKLVSKCLRRAETMCLAKGKNES